MIRLLISEPSLILKGKLNQYTKNVIEEKDEFNYNVFDFEENSFEEIVDALQTPSFSSLKKSPKFVPSARTISSKVDMLGSVKSFSNWEIYPLVSSKRFASSSWVKLYFVLNSLIFFPIFKITSPPKKFDNFKK